MIKYVKTDSNGRITVLSARKWTEEWQEIEVPDTFGGENSESIDEYIVQNGTAVKSPKPKEITDSDRLTAMEDALAELLIAQYGGGTGNG